MAEHVSITGRGPDGRILPRSEVPASARIRAKAVARWTEARTDGERLSTAVDFLRAEAAAASRGGVDPSEALDRAIRVLWAAGEQLTRRLAESEDRDV